MTKRATKVTKDLKVRNGGAVKGGAQVRWSGPGDEGPKE